MSQIKKLAKNKDATLLKAKIELAKRYFMDYLLFVHEGKWGKAKHLEVICNEMDNIIKGDTKRLMIFMPPRHGKSMTVTESFPSYYLGRFPDKKVIEISYGDVLAKRFGKLNRDKINEYGSIMFGIGISADQTNKTNWLINGKTGGMISVGLGGGITGFGADLLILDDPIKNRQEAESIKYREWIWGEYQSTVATRLQAGGAIIIILTRWHEDDLAGRLLNPTYGKVEDWKVLSLPAICEVDDDILGRKIGDVLWPEGGYDEEWAAIQKEVVGTYAWSSLYQQRPAPAAGGIFKRGWWQRWKELPGDLFDYIQSWDCTFKGTNESDYVVGQVWARSKKQPANRYLVDQVRGRMDFTETIQAIRDLSAKYPQTHRKLVEDKANGPAVMNVLRREITGLIPVEPEGGKVVRAHAVTAAVEAGNVFIPDSSIASWVNDFIEELSAFPSATNDDMVDAMTQANAYYNSKGSFVALYQNLM